jgi:hypothetical protein
MTLLTDHDPDLERARAILAAVTQYESDRLGYAVTLTEEQKWLALEQARAIGEFPPLNS